MSIPLELECIFKPISAFPQRTYMLVSSRNIETEFQNTHAQQIPMIPQIHCLPLVQEFLRPEALIGLSASYLQPSQELILSFPVLFQLFAAAILQCSSPNLPASKTYFSAKRKQYPPRRRQFLAAACQMTVFNSQGRCWGMIAHKAKCSLDRSCHLALGGRLKTFGITGTRGAF